MVCRYGLSADIYSFGITVIEAALGHTPYVDMSFKQIVTKKAVNAGVPMLAVNTHGRHFSQVRKHSLSNPIYTLIKHLRCNLHTASILPSIWHLHLHHYMKMAILVQFMEMAIAVCIQA